MTRGLHNVFRLSPHECFLYMISWAAHTTILFHTYKTSTKGLFGTQKYKTEEWKETHEWNKEWINTGKIQEEVFGTKDDVIEENLKH